MSCDSSKASSTTSNAKLPVAVVGAGLAGLTAAVELAQGGARVVLLESAGKPGGRAQTREAGEYRFNLGPRALYVSGAARAILDQLGIEYSGRRPNISRGAAWIEGRSELLPASPWSLITCPWLRPAERFEVMAFIARLPRLDLARAADLSFETWLEGNLRRRGSRLWLRAMTRLSTYMADFSRLDATAGLRQLQRSFEGLVLYLDGGWQTLVDGLCRSLESSGGRVETDTRVKRIDLDSGAAVEIVTETGVFRASAVVLAVAPEVAARLLPEERSFREACETMRPVHAACLDVALHRLPRPEATFGLGIDTPFYLSVHSAAADLAPEGGAMIHVLRYLRPEESLSRQQLRGQLEAVLDDTQPGWRERVIDEQMLPRMRVACHMPAPGRPMAPVDIAGLSRLRVAGDWVGDGGLLADAAVSSGRQAARSLLPELGIRPPVSNHYRVA